MIFRMNQTTVISLDINGNMLLVIIYQFLYKVQPIGKELIA